MSVWAKCNHTELLQVCLDAQLPAHPRMTREELVQLLECTAEPVTNPMDAWRDALAQFIDDYWVRLRSQLTCPARSHDPAACYGCLDAQVAVCLYADGSNEVQQLIKLRKKP